MGTVYVVVWYDPSDQRVCVGGVYEEEGDALRRLYQIEKQEADGNERARGMPLAGLRVAVLNRQPPSGLPHPELGAEIGEVVS